MLHILQISAGDESNPWRLGADNGNWRGPRYGRGFCKMPFGGSGLQIRPPCPPSRRSIQLGIFHWNRADRGTSSMTLNRNSAVLPGYQLAEDIDAGFSFAAS